MNVPLTTSAIIRTVILFSLAASPALPTRAQSSANPPSTPAPSPPPAPPPTHSTQHQSTTTHVPWNQPMPQFSRPFGRDPVFELKEIKRRWAEIFREDIAPPFFFPPVPPALAATLSPRITPPHAKNYPAGLVDFSAETFFMPYGSLLHRDWFSPKRSERIEAYRLKRQHLLEELRARLGETENLPESERIAARQAFAATQEEPLRALEAEAEAIRLDLTAPGMFSPRGEDGATLLESTGDLAGSDDEDALTIVRPIVTAYFHDGLSSEQRHLLREIGLQARLRAATSPGKPGADYLFFSPATARIRLPADLPAEVADQLERYTAAKDRLKEDLQAAIARNDYVFVFQRTERFEQLAARQAPHFAALDALAEQLRASLVRIPYVDAPLKSTLPPDLTRRVGLAVERKAALQRHLTTRYRTLRADLGPASIEIVRDGKTLGLALTAQPRLSSHQRTRVTTELAAFNDDLRRRYLALDAEMETLRQDLQRHAARSGGSPHDVDRLAAEFNRSYSAQDTWARFHDYYVAVLEPGLSPRQRQLLYNAATVDLLKHQLKSSF